LKETPGLMRGKVWRPALFMRAALYWRRPRAWPRQTIWAWQTVTTGRVTRPRRSPVLPRLPRARALEPSCWMTDRPNDGRGRRVRGRIASHRALAPFFRPRAERWVRRARRREVVELHRPGRARLRRNRQRDEESSSDICQGRCGLAWPGLAPLLSVLPASPIVRGGAFDAVIGVY